MNTPGAWKSKTFKSVHHATRAQRRMVKSHVKRGYELTPEESGILQSRNFELESELIESPSDELFFIYADHLARFGDPRAELISIHAAAERDPGNRAVRAAGHRLLRDRSPYFLGALAPMQQLLKLEWRLGFIHHARVGVETEMDAGTEMCRGALEKLLPNPSARYLRGLTLGVPGWEPRAGRAYDITYVGAAGYRDVLPAFRVDMPALWNLTIGDVGTWKQLESWVRVDWNYTFTGDFAPLWQHLPNLRHLVLQGGEIEIGRLELPRLRSLFLRSTSLTPDMLRCFETGTWPELETVHLWLSESGAWEQVLYRLFRGEACPRLRHLGLMNSPMTDELCEMIVRAPLLEQLESLDFSFGTMSDDGAQVLLSNVDALEHLKFLNVHRNDLTWAEQTLHGVCQEVFTGHQDGPTPSVTGLGAMQWAIDEIAYPG